MKVQPHAAFVAVYWLLMRPHHLEYAKPLPPRPILSARTKRWLRRAVPYAAAFILCYTSSYVCLSVYGRFEPTMMSPGQNGMRVGWYHWVPAGFARGFRHRWWLFEIYLPLYLADRNYWHTNADAYTGKYPTTEPMTRADAADWQR